MMYPEPLNNSETFITSPVRPKPPPYGASTTVDGAGDLVLEEPPPSYPASRLPSPRNPAATIFTTAGTTAYQRPIRNQMVRTVNPNVQIPSTYPGFTFCKFTPGRVETVIRLTVVVMLLVLIGLSGAAIHEEGQVITDGVLTVDAADWRGVAGWIIFIASVEIITEALMLTLRYINPSCINNNYSACGGLDISKCILIGIGLFIGCIITGAEAAIADNDFDDHCNDNPYNTDNNRACRHLQNIHRLVTAVTIINVVCIVLLVILTSWDFVYIYNGFNAKLPVPRARDLVNQQRQTQNETSRL